MPGFVSSISNNNEAVFANNADFSGSSDPSETNGLQANGQLWVGASALNAGGTHINVGTITSPDNSMSFGFSTPNITAQVNRSVVTDYHVARFIVSAGGSADGANYTTIASAITAAVAAGGKQTVFIQPGTYTENLTLAPNVNLTAFQCDSSLNITGSVIINGNATLSTAGTVTISGIQLQTNSAALLTVSGSAASIVNLVNCYLNCSNATGIAYSSSSASSAISLNSCNGNIGTTGIALFSNSSAGTLLISNSLFNNSGGTSTANTASAGTTRITYSGFSNPITTSSTAAFALYQSSIGTSTQNVACLTIGGSGGQAVDGCNLSSGTASTISVSSSLAISNVILGSTNTNAITGAGSVSYTSLMFASTGVDMNPSTLTGGVFRSGVLRSTTQPAFLATSAGALNVTGDGTAYTVVFGNEIFDQGNVFNGTSTFTAPYTGRYQIQCNVVLLELTASHTTGDLALVTSNRTYSLFNGNFANLRSGLNAISIGGSVLADMDAGDTATVVITVSNGTKVVDTFANTTTFSAFLVC